ncbi:Cytochrome P450 monooxygenase ATR2 [Colletotrichum orbiculare MAFF 240422]|uniref:Cytochrome P450 monooxygenase ATR2 n=1 Tax=Colletotrichum orbiculare (strain 104-T / ATCC 96160 / CBS 514.97 / LARS 414 / MAFF 240422) TaxID=1213857 RepID=A0A484G458_COLOR|nr:Cytochrome P450 monooxygenase ATR2 [Colletotrichum orbiculare MAFF 240422]
MANVSDSYTPAGPAQQSYWASTLAGVVFVAFVLFSQSWFKANPLAHVPVMGKGSRWARRKYFMQGNATQMFLDAYRTHKDSISLITTAKTRDSILVPPKYLPELSKAPDDVISAGKAVEEFIQSKYTTVGFELPIFVHVSRANLTPALNDLNPAVAETIAKTLRRDLAPTATWSEVAINAKLLRIIAIASGHVFVGPELCSDEAYLGTSIDFTQHLMKAVYGIAMIPSFLRPLVAPWLPMTRALHRRLADADAVFQPIVTARQQASAGAGEGSTTRHNDMLQWMLDAQTRVGELSTRDLALAQLGASFAAIHTTTMTATNAVYWLAAKPELAPVLRDEVERVLAGSGGRFTTAALADMKKMDSFLREVMRVTPLSASAYVRKVLKPFELSNGQVIPAGVFVEVPSVGINRDPDVFPDPDVFDALRFYELRMGCCDDDAARAGQLQAAHVGVTHLSFSFGKHACPGRVFAVNEIKMLLSGLLRDYDIKLPDGVRERYPSLVFGDQASEANVPDPTKTIMMKQREVLA